MRRIICCCLFYEKFRTVEYVYIWKFSLKRLCCSWSERRFDDGDLPFSDKRQHIADRVDVVPVRRGRCRHCNENNVAFSKLIPVREEVRIKRIAHDIIPAILKIVSIILAYPALSDKSYFHIAVT